MQAIARVNRVFRDKPAGLILDYIGIAQNLKNALGQYSASEQKKTGIDDRDAIAELLRRYEIVKAMFHGFDYMRSLTGASRERLSVMVEAIEWTLEQHRKAAEQEKTEAEQKHAHRRYQDAVLGISKAFALASASDEVGFFQTIRAALVKSSESSGRTTAERELAVQQLIDWAVASTEIVDSLSAAGLSSPDISILSDEFLAEVSRMEKKNLALEALKKLLNDEIRSRSQSNVVETPAILSAA